MTPKCGCDIEGICDQGETHYIVYCPMHKAAPVMLDALKEALIRFDGDEQGNITQIREALRAAEGSIDGKPSPNGQRKE